MWRSWHGRASIGLTLVLAGLLASRMISADPEEARREAPAPPSTTAKAEASKPKPEPAIPAKIVLPPPPRAISEAPVPSQSTPQPVLAAPKIEPLKKSPPPPLKPPPRAALKPLKPLAPVPAVQPKSVSLTPLRPKPQKTPPRPVTPTPAKLTDTARVEKTTVAAIREPVSRPGVHAAAKGRVLLRVLEHGKGPAIEIAWPSRSGSRGDLSRLLQRCYGMELALMDSKGRLYADEGLRGQVWRPNRDLYSGFVRHTSGILPESERRAEAAIRGRHGRRGDLVHVFPRRVDALLLGGIRNLTGAKYGSARSIRARYEVRNQRVLVSGFDVDGQSLRGAIDLGAAAHCRGGTS